MRLQLAITKNLGNAMLLSLALFALLLVQVNASNAERVLQDFDANFTLSSANPKDFAIPDTSDPPAVSSPSFSPSLLGVVLTAPIVTTAPTFTPSVEAISFPSREPSPRPSALPSSQPSKPDTLYPSNVPSDLPSQLPTLSDSQGPSIFPSASPTMECHDNTDYKSPMNGLSCLNHSGTDCTNWYYVLDQNITALEELINSCPVSCKIPCGAFLQQIIELSFIISDVPGLLDVVTQQPLEEVALDYLTDFVKAKKVSEMSFQLKSVLLKAQQPLFRRQLRASPLRQVQEEDISLTQLRVVLTLVGFSVGIETDRLTNLLIGGIDSVGFTNALQISSTFYAEAKASYAVQEFPRGIEVAPMKKTSDPGVAASTIIIVVIAALVFVFAVGFFGLRHYQSRKHKEGSITSGSLSMNMDTDTHSPVSSGSNEYFSLSRVGSSTPRGVRYYPEGNLLGSLSRSRDSDEYDEESIFTEINLPLPSCDQIRKAEDDAKKHPLTGKVPAMVVIDNIDGSTPEKLNEAEGTSVVPTKHVSASSSFAQALQRTSSKPMDMLCAFSSPKNGGAKSGPSTPYSVRSDASKEGLSFLGHAVHGTSPASLDDSSVASTPVRGTDMDLGDIPVLRRSVSGGDIDAVDNNGSFGDVLRSAFPSPGVTFFVRKDTSNVTESPSLKKRRATKAEFSPSVVRSIHTPKLLKNGPSSGVRSRPMSPGNADIILPPLSRSRSGPDALLNTIKPSHVRARSHSRGRQGVITTSRGSQNRRSKSGSSIRRDKSSSAELRYVIDAPTGVKLGLTIESGRKGDGSKIHFVKDYSPLYGLVNCGDKIVSIDNVNTTAMDAKGIHHLLSRKRENAGAIRLIVARQTDKSSIPTLPLGGQESPQFATIESGGSTLTPRRSPYPAPTTPKRNESQVLPVFLNSICDDEADSFFE